MTQPNLFGDPPPVQPLRVAQWQLPAGYGYRTHRGDPETSREAERKMVQSGALTRQAAQVLDAWKAHGPATSKQLAERSGLDYYLIQRRKSDLSNLLVETGRVIDGCREYRTTNQEGL